MKKLFFLIALAGSCTALQAQLKGDLFGTAYDFTKPTSSQGYYSTTSSTPSAPATISSYNPVFTEFMKNEAYDVYKKAVAAHNSRNWKKALSLYKKAAKMDPGNAVYRDNVDKISKYLDDLKAYETKKKEQEKAYEERKKQSEKNVKLLLGEMNNDLSAYQKQVGSLRKTIASYVPPLGTPKKVIKEGIILGLMNTMEKNDVSKVQSPLTGHQFQQGEYFATTDNDSWTDIYRVMRDNISIGEYTLKTAYGKKLVEELNGTKFERLFAHSNGATITEALIRENVITVDELNILGGDRSYANFQEYKKLVETGKVKKIIVWYNPADIVPYGTSFRLLLPKSDNKEKEEIAALYDAFFKTSLTNVPGVEFRRMAGPKYPPVTNDFDFNLDHIFNAHFLTSYFDNMNRYYRK